MILLGGDVYTVDASRSWAQAVAVRGERIVAVGSDEEVRPLAGPATEVIDLGGRMLVPGFQDAHVHPPQSGRHRLRVDLEGVHTLEGYRRIISEYARSRPQEPWIVGGGWSMDLFPGGTPRREDLDDIVPDRPVFLMNRDGHGAWVNGRALEVAGITGDSPDPWDGRIERDPATGEPSGTLHEGAAYSLEDLLPPVTEDEWIRAILESQAHLHSLGITAWQDAWVTPEILRAYRAVAEDGRLTARVNASLWWERHRGLEQADALLEQREWGTVGNLRADTVKFMADGIVENCTAALREPYLGRDGRATENRGISFVEREALAEAVSWADAHRFQAHIHAIGDRAIRDALDAVASAQRANGRRDARHHIAHLQVVHPDDVPRFRDLGVVANVQMVWACMEPQMEELTLPFLGPERSGWQYPFGELVRQGATLACGSDWSVSTPNPLRQIEVGVTRVDPRDRGSAPFLPEQGLPLAKALAAFTMGSAYVSHRDAESGSIEPGKLADLAVIDRNVLEPDAGPISDARVDLTLVGGRVAYER